MRRILVVLILLVGLSVLAQPVFDKRKLLAGSGAPNLTDIPSLIGLTISNRWIAQRFCYGEGVSDWVDETNHFHWVLENGAQPPTNSTLGVWLDATHYFYGTNIMQDGSLVHFAIIKLMQADTSVGNNFLFTDVSDGGQLNFLPKTIDNLGELKFVSPSSVIFSLVDVPTNVVYNFIYAGNDLKAYTNGVLANGSIPSTWKLSSPVRIGASSLGVSGFIGYLQELITYTDSTINASQISNLNYYASHYPYSNSTCSASAIANAVVNDWTNRVANNGGALPADATRTALVTFVSGLITDGLDTSMLSVMPFVPDNLTAALTPLYHVIGSDPWVNHNFVSGNLTVNGLIGDSATKYLDSGINTTALPSFTSVAFSVYNYTGDVAADGTWGAWAASDGYDLFLSSGNLVCSINYSTAGAGRISFSSPSWAGFTIGSRVANNDLKLYTANSGTAFAQKASNTAVVTDQRAAVNKVFNLYAYNNNGTPSAYSGKRLSFFAVTSGFNATQAQNFYNRVQQLRVDLGGGFQ